MTFIAGGYTATYADPETPGGNDVLGQIEDGFNLEFTIFGEPIRGDNFGDGIQDHVIRGMDCFIDFVLLEYNLALAAEIFTPLAAAVLGQVDAGMTGQLISARAGKLILTSITGPNAAPTIYTFAKAHLAIGYPVRLLLAPRLRRVPLRLQIQPVGTPGTPPAGPLETFYVVS